MPSILSLTKVLPVAESTLSSRCLIFSGVTLSSKKYDSPAMPLAPWFIMAPAALAPEAAAAAAAPAAEAPIDIVAMPAPTKASSGLKPRDIVLRAKGAASRGPGACSERAR